MKFTEIFIKRPVLALVVSIVVVMLGWVTLNMLAVRQYPQIDLSIVSIETQYNGASPEVVESQITRELEERLAGLPGMDYMVSSSEMERSKITVYFASGVSLDAAASDIADRVRGMDLPESVPPPKVSKADLNAIPVMSLVLYGEKYTVQQLYDFAQRYIEQALKAVNGVASVMLQGGAPQEMQLQVDPLKAASYVITHDDLQRAVHAQSVNKPGGYVVEAGSRFSIETKARIDTEEGFNAMPLPRSDIKGNSKEGIVRFGDIGVAKIAQGEEHARIRFNGQPCVTFNIVANAQANPIDISAAVNKRLQGLRADLPEDLKLDVASDESIFIKKSLHEVYKTLAEAVFLVVIVILVFLGSWRAALVPLFTIPISLIGAGFFMYLCGFSINTLTLLAFVLAIGLVVDDAIVVLENIYRHIEEGMTPFRAALKGANEIGFAVVCMTLTLVAVYAPIALAQGMTGKLFTEFAITLAAAVLVSGLAALTLSPMMCAYILKPIDHNHTPSRLSPKAFIERILAWIENAYALFLDRRVMPLRWIVLLLSLGVGFVGYKMATGWLPSELSPREDQGVLKTYSTGRNGATMESLDPQMKLVEEKVLNKEKYPHIANMLTSIEMGGASESRSVLVPWEDRPHVSCAQIASEMNKEFEGFGDMSTSAYCQSRSLMGGGADQPLSFVYQSNRPLLDMIDTARDIIRILYNDPMLNIISNPWDVPAESANYVIVVDRVHAASLGVDPSTVANLLFMLVKKQKIGNFEIKNKMFSVKAMVDPKFLVSVESLRGLYVRSSVATKDGGDTMVPLSDLIKIERRLSRPSIHRFEGMRAITFTTGLAKGVGLSDAYKSLKEKIKPMLPEGDRVTESGSLRRLLQEANSVLLIVGLAVAFIFLIMAAQFESFIDPLIIMFSVPLALSGALVTLWFVPQGSMNIYSQIGLITLIGLITKHGILILDFANTKRDLGFSVRSSIVEASKMRFRPILMTTLAMVLGAVPLALSTGAGCEARRQIGWVIVGGMSIGTLFTLLVIPAAYACFSRRKPHMVFENDEMEQINR